MIGNAPICLTCKHFHSSNKNGFTCNAFPDGVPEVIVMALEDHQEEIGGEVDGITYEPLADSTGDK